VDGFDAFRANRASSAGATFGARRAHSAISVFVGKPRHRGQLLRAQRTLVRRRRDLRQRLDRPRGLELVAHRARRIPTGVEGRIDLAALVEDPQHRELLGVQSPLLIHQHVAFLTQPVRRPRPQLVEVIGDVEHAPIQTRGYDAYRPNRRFTGRQSYCFVVNETPLASPARFRAMGTDVEVLALGADDAGDGATRRARGRCAGSARGEVVAVSVRPASSAGSTTRPARRSWSRPTRSR